MNQEENY
jgi:hypothetical protein